MKAKWILAGFIFMAFFTVLVLTMERSTREPSTRVEFPWNSTGLLSQVVHVTSSNGWRHELTIDFRITLPVKPIARHNLRLEFRDYDTLQHWFGSQVINASKISAVRFHPDEQPKEFVNAVLAQLQDYLDESEHRFFVTQVAVDPYDD